MRSQGGFCESAGARGGMTRKIEGRLRFVVSGNPEAVSKTSTSHSGLPAARSVVSGNSQAVSEMNTSNSIHVVQYGQDVVDDVSPDGRPQPSCPLSQYPIGIGRQHNYRQFSQSGCRIPSAHRTHGDHVRCSEQNGLKQQHNFG